MKSYRPYTILDNHASGIYSSRNLSLLLYYTRSPSVAYGASSLVRGSLTAFPLNQNAREFQFIGKIQQSDLAVMPHIVSM